MNAAVPRAVVIGSGPNGLAAAITLARAGLEVEVHEAEEQLGGGLRSAELTLPGFVHDVCSSVHPLSLASPLFRTLELDVDWVQPDAPAAHPFDDGTAVLLERSLLATAAGLGRDDGAYRRLVGPLVESWPEVERVLLGPHPLSPRTLLQLGDRLGPRGLAAALRAGLSSARALAEGHFADERTRAWFAGHAAHSMLPLERRPSAGFGLTLAVLGHVVGWPFPRGGSQRLADALTAKLRDLGGEIRTSSLVDSLPRADLVLADVVPRELLRLARGRLPERYERALHSYRHGPGAFKVDWALDGPIPWSTAECRRAGTVHLGGSLDEISASEWDAWRGRPAERPFVLLAQTSLFDPTRAPAGKHTAWAYCHVPNSSAEDMTERIEAQVERFAPGFHELVLARHTMGPAELEARNRNLVGGDLNAGAMDLGQLLLRPVRRPVPYRTPLTGVYLCSAATPPGGGVHGMCGFSAARVALRDLERA
ncbi:MAG: FAD-dependent oxidoreductase [Actinobacteria bacterium 13_2_20CM_68_14]|nr:MAG: FAD-dependent oxidoreductase [Actinobacteria bacterium 13_2_20CM_68_14]